MPTDASTTTGFLNLIIGSGPVARIVLAILLLFSIVSWAVILERWRLFAKAQKQSKRFLNAFHEQDDLHQLSQAARHFPDSPAANVFASVYTKFGKLLYSAAPSDVSPLTELVFRELNQAGQVQLARFQKRLTLLATAASVCPFLGLFGTVWGVMNSFLGIAAAGNTTLAVVAPGIAEALLATALGLVAAIPASIAYNSFTTDLARYAGRLEDFSGEFGTILARQLEVKA